MTKTQAKQQIKKLLEKYEKLEKEGKIKNYNEAQTRNEFIEPLFEALGWDMRNLDHENEVTTEENVSGGRVDLAFRLNNIPVMFLEAKAMKVDLDEWKWAEQAINYSWNKGVDWAVLTDFEGIKVFNATLPPKGPGENRFLTLSYKDYLNDFEKLWWLSKESMKEGILEKEARKTGLLKERRSVDEVLFGDLMEWRQKLSSNFAAYNEKVEHDLLDEGVQKLLDRLIFIRTAEDRKIEEKILIVKLREWEKKGRKGSLMQVLDEVFNDFKETYDSKLFENHPFEKWEIEDDVLEKVIKGLYESGEGYTYDFSAISADVLGGIYEQYLGHILEKAKKSAKVTEKHKKRKSQGIYYTPKFIVDYIVTNTLGKKLKELKKNSKNLLGDVKKLKVLDPACGSGSFLIQAFETLDEFYEKECGATGDPMARRMEILLNNIYGVDLDPQAVEIARLNLLLRALQGKGSLPSLEGNIKCGNSLISGTEKELREYFGKEWREKRAFNWQEEFPEVFKGGGFDVVIANPPYITYRGKQKVNVDENEIEFYQKKFVNSAEYKINSFALFLEQGAKILSDSGTMSYIIPSTFLQNKYLEKIRRYLLADFSIEKIMTFGDRVFSAITDSIILFVTKRVPVERETSVIFKNNLGSSSDDKEITFNPNHWLESAGSIINLRITKEDYKITSKMEANSETLDHFLKVYVGVVAHGIKKFLSDAKINSLCKKYLQGKHIARYKVAPAKLFINFDIGRLHSNTDEKVYLQPEKILVRKTGSTLIAAYDDEQFYTDQSIYNLYPGNKNKLDLKYILALLNSALMNFYFRKKMLTNPDVFPYIKGIHLKKLPLKAISLNRQKCFIGLIDKILGLNKELLKVEENSEEWKGLKKEVEKVDGEINQEVYKLYGLSEKEIELIEGSDS